MSTGYFTPSRRRTVILSIVAVIAGIAVAIGAYLIGVGAGTATAEEQAERAAVPSRFLSSSDILCQDAAESFMRSSGMLLGAARQIGGPSEESASSWIVSRLDDIEEHHQTGQLAFEACIAIAEASD